VKKIAVHAVLCLSAIAFIGSRCQAFASKLGVFESHKDIGLTPKRGTCRYDRKTAAYRVTGGGANMWLNTDAFQFVYQQISGDVTLTADIQFVGQGVEEHRKAALMIRRSLQPDSAYADAALHGDGLTSLQYRSTSGAQTKEIRSDLKAPVRIRIERRGNEFTMSVGNPGEDLKSTPPIGVALQNPVYVGLAVCSHNANILETALFSNVNLQRAQKQTDNHFQLLSDRQNF
jgi:regulation of enolase protein 1 (concanavalin A-like superfamily)